MIKQLLSLLAGRASWCLVKVKKKTAVDDWQTVDSWLCWKLCVCVMCVVDQWILVDQWLILDIDYQNYPWIRRRMDINGQFCRRFMPWWQLKCRYKRSESSPKVPHQAAGRSLVQTADGCKKSVLGATGSGHQLQANDGGWILMVNWFIGDWCFMIWPVYWWSWILMVSFTRCFH